MCFPTRGGFVLCRNHPERRPPQFLRPGEDLIGEVDTAAGGGYLPTSKALIGRSASARAGLERIESQREVPVGVHHQPHPRGGRHRHPPPGGPAGCPDRGPHCIPAGRAFQYSRCGCAGQHSRRSSGFRRRRGPPWQWNRRKRTEKGQRGPVQLREGSGPPGLKKSVPTVLHPGRG